MLHEPQNFHMEITHADGTVVKHDVRTGGGPADEKFVEEHFRKNHPDAQKITVTKTDRDLSAEAAAVAKAVGQTKLAEHLAKAATPAPTPAAATPAK